MKTFKAFLILVALAAPVTAFAGLDGQLIKASKKGDLEQVKALLDKGADIDAREKGFLIKSLNTPLMLASYEGHKNVVEELLKRGASVNVKNSYDGTALILAAWKGHADIAGMLVEKGADINAQTNKGVTALMKAVMHEYPSVAKLLIEDGADTNIKANDGWTALMYAARFDQKAIAEALLEKGADVSARSAKGKTAEMYASSNRNSQIVQLLKNSPQKETEVAQASGSSGSAGGSPSSSSGSDQGSADIIFTDSQTGIIYSLSQEDCTRRGYGAPFVTPDVTGDIPDLKILYKEDNLNHIRNYVVDSLLSKCPVSNGLFVLKLFSSNPFSRPDNPALMMANYFRTNPVIINYALLMKKMNDRFVSKYKVESLPSFAQLSGNPFVYKGKTIGVHVKFETMDSESAGVFANYSGIAGFGGGSGAIFRGTMIVSSLPGAKFTSQGQVALVAAKVLGNIKYHGNKVPHLSFVGAYFCADAHCSEVKPKR